MSLVWLFSVEGEPWKDRKQERCEGIRSACLKGHSPWLEEAWRARQEAELDQEVGAVTQVRGAGILGEGRGRWWEGRGVDKCGRDLGGRCNKTE